MTLPKRLLIAVLLVSALATPSWAEWTVARVSPPARYALDGETWLPLSRGMEVPESAWIRTGRTGRLLLRRPGELIQFKPNTVGAVVSRAAPEGPTVLQKFGEIFLDVEAGTRVETPYLGAMVKGTRVEVAVGLHQVRLHVRQGLVEVTDLVRSQRVDVRAGQQVIVSARRDRGLTLEGPGPKGPIVDVAPREPRVSPARPARQVGPATTRSWERNDDDDDASSGLVRFDRRRIEEGAERGDRDPGGDPDSPAKGGDPDSPAKGGDDAEGERPEDEEPGDGSDNGGAEGPEDEDPGSDRSGDEGPEDDDSRDGSDGGGVVGPEDEVPGDGSEDGGGGPVVGN